MIYVSESVQRRGRRRRLAALLAVLAAVAGVATAAVLLAGRGGTQRAAATSPMPAASSAALPRCDRLAGLPTKAAIETACLRPDGTINLNMSASYDCKDGRSVHWNDTGWGWSDGKWQAHKRKDGQLVPPESVLEKCLG